MAAHGTGVLTAAGPVGSEKNGFISASDLRKVMTSLGDKLSNGAPVYAKAGLRRVWRAD
jgi:hypothetical protein